MKINKFLLPVVASAMLFTGCDDQIMEWGLQDGHTAVTSADPPLAVKEVLPTMMISRHILQPITPI